MLFLGRKEKWEANKVQPHINRPSSYQTYPEPNPRTQHPVPCTMSSSAAMNKYWIPHLDIHKKVITQELQYYLGPEATVRSFTREVRELSPSNCCNMPNADSRGF